jgi:hypothetical protein
MAEVLKIQSAGKEIYDGHLSWSGENPSGDRIDFTNFYLRWNGRPWLPVMGEFHFSRFPCEFWEEELLKMKAGGVQIVATYAFWNHHEEKPGQFDFEGRRNLRSFIKLCDEHGLFVWPRLGPFCHGEVRNGGIPDWLYGQPFQIRCNDEQYLAYVRRLYNEYAKQMEGFLFKDGGPIIGVQLENEFMQSGAPWETTPYRGMEYVPRGSGGDSHMLALKRLAKDAGIDVPVYSCTAWGSPVPDDEFLPVIGGGYAFHAWLDDPESQKPTGCYLFSDLHSKGERPYDETKVPYAGCETGGGMQVFYKNRPVVPPEAVEAVSVIQMGSGCNLMGFYMYHGGSNPKGKCGSFLNEYKCPRISYDFQAPLREFGQISESYRRLKRHFLFLDWLGEELAPMVTCLPDNSKSLVPENTHALRFAVRTKDSKGFVFLNNFQDHVETEDLFNQHIRIDTGEENIPFPYDDDFTLLKNKSAVLPFNLELGGVLLRSALAQPLAHIEVGGELWYFFFEPEGMDAQYVFDAKTLTSFELTGDGNWQQKNGFVIVEPDPGLNSVIRLISRRGKESNVVTLTHAQSLNFWTAPLWGKERALIFDGGVLFRNGNLELRQEGEETFECFIIPGTKVPLSFGSELTRVDRRGVFQRHRLRVQKWRGHVEIEQSQRPGTDTVWDGMEFVSRGDDEVSYDQAVVQVKPSAFEGLSELRLEVEYEGDRAEAYIDGELIHDNFNNGTPWILGLKRFEGQLKDNELYLRAIPEPSSGSDVEYTEMAAIHTGGSKDIARIRSISVQPEYKVSLGMPDGSARS